MSYRLERESCRDLRLASATEWMLPNGIGGYAMGTVSGANTRRYHGLLIAATVPPATRMLLVSNVEFSVESNGQETKLSTNMYPGAVFPDGYLNLESFELDTCATWTYRVDGFTITKRLHVVEGTNQVRLEFSTSSATPVTLRVRPLLAFRDHHGEFSRQDGFPTAVETQGSRTEVCGHGVTLSVEHGGATTRQLSDWYYRQHHYREAERGLSQTDDCFCPIELQFQLSADRPCQVSFTEGDHIPSEPEKRSAEKSEIDWRLRNAVTPFLVRSSDRTTMIAGYPWFSDWGRDTMISLPGYLAATGHHAVARQILRDFARYLDHGMLPNRFPESGDIPEYNTVDATLWWANAAYFTLRHAWDDDFAKVALSTLQLIVDGHVAGTRYGIGVDPTDGLVVQGDAETQLTWMDARVDGKPMTSRHGKAIEINALWVNLLGVQQWLCEKINQPFINADLYALASQSLYEKFGPTSSGGLKDTIEPDDLSVRPNQIIALSLPFVNFDASVALEVLRLADAELVTPNGLRTLGSSDPRYRGRFEGDMRARDSAYHMGTVWPWLFGPYFTACLRYRKDAAGVRRQMLALKRLYAEYGLGGVAEVYDGDAPQNPGGCPWQAWSACELARIWFDELPRAANQSRD